MTEATGQIKRSNKARLTDKTHQKEWEARKARSGGVQRRGCQVT